MRFILILAAAMAAPTMAAQAEPPRTSAPWADDELSIYVPDIRAARVPANPEVMALARRLAEATQEAEIALELSDLIADVEQADEPPPGFGVNPAPDAIVAYSPLQPATALELEMHQRLMERIAAYYAATFDLGELRQLVAFFESPAARKFGERRGDLIAHARAALRSPEFQAELHEAMLAAERRQQGPQDGPNHAYVRLPAGTAD